MSEFLVSDSSAAYESYGQLLKQVEPKKLENEADYLKFVDLLESLLEKEGSVALSTAESRLVDLLLVLVQDYERQTVNLPNASPLDVLTYLMDENSLKQVNLVGLIGSSGVVSEILNGKREISKSQARSLGERFNVSYKLFL